MSDEHRWRLEEGDEIAPGRFALTKLGGGFRYEAYLTWDETLYSIVVVKVVRPHLVENERALRGLNTEYEMLRRLSHPVILRAFDAVLDGPRPHLVLEHLEGPRLSTLIRKYDRLPLEQLLPLALQLCSAVHYLAYNEVCHLDLKPTNIIMSGPPRLIDLSIARTFEQAAAARFEPEALVDEDHARCQREGARLRGLGYAGVLAPGAALPGEINITLFGPRMASTWNRPPFLASSLPTTVITKGAPPPGVLARVRQLGTPHAGLVAYTEAHRAAAAGDEADRE